ncbi:MAG: peptidylprolyl isomerase [Gemmatimonadota bacterium]|nr:peptidylprolyl isomerase [Gemmatimonadota bacterium]MDH5758111.1 peptidylprolyl isomerase [Gemmatimonadota bacterium]
MIVRRALLIAAVAGILPLPALGQWTKLDSTTVDRVVAVVGDSVILYSQVEEEIQRRRLMGQPIPTDPVQEAAVYRQILDEWVNRVLILRAAARDTLVTPDEDRIEDTVDTEIENRTQQAGGQVAFQQLLAREGITLASYREMLKTQVRQEQVQRMFLQLRAQDMPPVIVSEAQLREAYDAASDRLARSQRPKLITFSQIVIAPEPSDSSKAVARAEIESLLERARAGEDFAELATANSDDPGTASNGGDLDWFRRGQMVKEFEDAAFNLFDGQISDVVETSYGYHIIKIERSRAGERKGRHILVMPERGPGDVAIARALADSLVDLVRSGTSMKELYDTYSDPDVPDSLTVAENQLTQLPPAYAVLRTAVSGEIRDPMEYQIPGGQSRIAVVRVDQVREAGAYTFEDVRDQLTQDLQQSMQIERIVADLRERTHIQILM